VIGDEDFRDRLIGHAPVTVRRRVMWGDCDPAQVVYTPRFADYVASAADWFWRVIMDGNSPSLSEAELYTPVKYLSFTFHHVLRPDDLFDMSVRVTAIRTRTLDLAIEAVGMDGTPRFSSVLSPILISSKNYQALPLPGHVRAALEAYAARCAVA
jgi:acyl-CoA thioester hydrolase